MNKTEKKYTGLFVLLGMLFVTCLLISNIIAGKMWSPGLGITLPASVILFPVTYIIADVLTEVYGFSQARLIIWSGFVCNFLAVITFVITVNLSYPQYFLDQEAYAVVLGITPRVLLASFIAYLFGEFSNSIVLSKLKTITKGKKLCLRTIGSTVVGEALDSVIFVIIAFAGTVTTKQLLSMILFEYLFKVCFEVVMTPVTYMVIGWMKKTEGIDTYDYDQKYSLF